jgi:hypothetical protein
MDDLKLLIHASEDKLTKVKEGEEKVEFCQLAVDKSESRNLAESNPEKVWEMRVRPDDFRKQAAGPPGSRGKKAR